MEKSGQSVCPTRPPEDREIQLVLLMFKPWPYQESFNHIHGTNVMQAKVIIQTDATKLRQVNITNFTTRSDLLNIQKQTFMGFLDSAALRCLPKIMDPLICIL